MQDDFLCNFGISIFVFVFLATMIDYFFFFSLVFCALFFEEANFLDDILFDTLALYFYL